MSFLFEDTLEASFHPDEVTPGQDVRVVTKMGRTIFEGRYMSIFGGHFAVRGGGEQRTFRCDLHELVIVPAGVPERVEPTLREVDDPSGTTDSAGDKDASKATPEQIQAGPPSGSPGGKPPKKSKAKEREDSPKDKQDKSAKAGIDTSKLPPSVASKIVGVKNLEPEQLNRVLSEMGEAALRALKKAGVKETEVYGLVHRLQAASKEVLTKKDFGK